MRSESVTESEQVRVSKWFPGLCREKIKAATAVTLRFVWFPERELIGTK